MTLSKHALDKLDAEIQRLKDRGTPFALATVVRTVDSTSAKPGGKALLDADGVLVEGWLGGGCARSAVAKAAREAIASGEPKFVSLRPSDLLDAEGVSAGEEKDGIRFARNGCPSEGSMDVFVEPVLPLPQLVICGGGMVATALADLSQRYDFARTLCAPGLDPTDLPPVDKTLDSFAFDVGEGRQRYIVVATQGKGDEAALRAALSSGAGYVAFVGSRKKFAKLAEKLEADGVDAAALEAVHAPAGLDIHAITPEEIALSIVAEIVSVRRAGDRSNG
ncbi:MAG: XdhC family protein [Alphaproteobacteria bacterium]|nr:XdhC family protein [Alphaproteobacteria bacterium]